MGSAGRALALDADRAAALYNVSATPEGQLQPFVATVARVAAPQPFPSHRITIPLPLADASQAGSGPAHDGSLLGRGRLGEGAQTGVLFLRPSPHRAQGRSQYVAVPSPTPPAGPGGGSAGPQGPSNLPPLPFPLSNLQQRAGARPGVDPLALKLGYFPLPFVEKYLAEVVALQAQITGLQGDLQGVKARLQAANGWVTSAVGAVTSLTGKSYGGANFDSTIADIPTDLNNLQVMIAAVENAGDPTGSQGFKVKDLFNGKFLTYLQQAIAATSQQLTGLENRLGSAQTFLNGLLTPMEQVVGATYSPRSFDARPLTGLPQDLANAIGPSGMGKILTYGGSLTGKTYGLPDLWNGNLLGDVKNWLSTSMATDVVSLNNLTQRLFNLVAQSARDFVGLVQVQGFNPVTQRFKSQASLDGLRPDDFGNMQDYGVGSETPESVGADGWEGDSLGIQANPWSPNQFDVKAGAPRRGLNEILTHPFARMRRQRLMDAIPTGINPSDYGQDMIINWGDGSSEHNNGPVQHTMGPGTFTPSLQPLVRDNKTGKRYGQGIFHNLRNYVYGSFPKVVKVVAPSVKDSNGNITNMNFQILGQKGQPLDDGSAVLLTRRDTGDAKDFVTRHIAHKLVRTQTTTIQTAPSFAGPWSSPQTLSGLALGEVDKPTGVFWTFHHDHVVPLRNPRVAYKADY